MANSILLLQEMEAWRINRRSTRYVSYL